MCNSICAQYLETDKLLREEHAIINGMLDFIQTENLSIEQINQLETIRFAEQRIMKLAKQLLNQDLINNQNSQSRGISHG